MNGMGGIALKASICHFSTPIKNILSKPNADSYAVIYHKTPYSQARFRRDDCRLCGFSNKNISEYSFRIAEY